jgi:hypothetical protein
VKPPLAARGVPVPVVTAAVGVAWAGRKARNARHPCQASAERSSLYQRCGKYRRENAADDARGAAMIDMACGGGKSNGVAVGLLVTSRAGDPWWP